MPSSRPGNVPTCGLEVHLIGRYDFTGLVAIVVATARSDAVPTGIVLAAGRSRRLSRVTGGGSKMLYRLGGEPLVARAARSLLALGLERVLVIVGHDADDVAAAACLDPRVEVVPAPDWKLGPVTATAASWQRGHGPLRAAAPGPRPPRRG
jgi:CTP:molybdopterin cytidylyltransferase MocA